MNRLRKMKNQESIFQEGGFDICSSPQETSIEESCSSLVDYSLQSELFEQHSEECNAVMFSFESHEDFPIQHEIVMVEKPVVQVTANKKDSIFVRSRGCPIKHLSWLEANGKPKFSLVHEHKLEDKFEEEAKHAFSVKQSSLISKIFFGATSHMIHFKKKVNLFIFSKECCIKFWYTCLYFNWLWLLMIMQGTISY